MIVEMNKITLKEIRFKKLKGLSNVTIKFSKPLTAIMGVNGSGKTTVIHALACLYNPDGNGENHIFPEFFTPNTDASWSGSELEAVNEIIGTDGVPTLLPPKKYYKSFDRWAPRYQTRPKRNVYYIGIETCLPDIEKKNQTTRISYVSQCQTSRIARKTIQGAAGILNKNYTALMDNCYKGTHFPGVELSDGLKYSSLSMGSGEQRTIKILEKVTCAEKYSLILVDELDLLLHVSAFRKLVKELNRIAAEKKLQIVFTTHSLEILSMSEYIGIQYIENVKTPTGSVNSFVYDRLSEELIYNMSGECNKPVKIYVEDSLAKDIVREIVRDLQMTLLTEICKFGAIENAFTLAASFIIEQRDTRNILIVTDGDKYCTDSERMDHIAKKLCGTEDDAEEKRQAALQLIHQFSLPTNTPPEKFLHQIILETFPQDNSIYQAAQAIHGVNDSHEWISNICDRLDESQETIIREIFKYASSYELFLSYIDNIKMWLSQHQNI